MIIINIIPSGNSCDIKLKRTFFHKFLIGMNNIHDFSVRRLFKKCCIDIGHLINRFHAKLVLRIGREVCYNLRSFTFNLITPFKILDNKSKLLIDLCT